jgi:tetratricopeptide (TPR) repeat protein
MNSRRGLAPQENRRIDSWKEIAAFFDRDERTVKRWERDRALPIHRLPGERGGVFAYTDELTRWLNSMPSAARAQEGTPIPIDSLKGVDLEDGPSESATDAASSTTLETEAPQAEAALAHEPLPPSDREPRPWRILAVALAASILIAGVLLTLHLRSNMAMRQPTAARRHIPDAEAAQFYLRGRYYWNLRTTGSLSQAVDAFTQAVVHDSEYAEAYAGLAECYDLMPLYSSMTNAEAFPRAIAAAHKAIALDDSLPEAHAALAFALFYWQWNSKAAFAEFQRAIQLDPRNSDAHHWYATSLMTVGRYQDALSEMNLAQQDDPTSGSVLADQAVVRYTSGDQAGAVDELHEVERDEPNFWAAHHYLANLWLDQKNFPEYLVEMKRYAELSKDPLAMASSEAASRGWAQGGERGLLEALRKVQEEFFRNGKGSGYDLGHTCSMLGRNQEAIVDLKAAYAARDFRVIQLPTQAWTAPLKGDPGFEQLMQQIASDLRHSS